MYSVKTIVFKSALVIFLFATGEIVHSQKLSVGATAGAGLPSLENFDFNNGDGLDGINYFGGAVAQLKVKKIAVLGELLFDYSQFEGDIQGISTTLTYSRITLPVLAKWYFLPGANFQVGGRIGFLLSAESEDEDGFTFDTANTTESTDIGLQAGFGYDLPLGLTVSARYNLGLTGFPGPDDNLSGFQLSLGYYFLETGGLVAGIPTSKRKKWKGK